MSRSELEAILRDAGYHVRYQTTKGTWKKVLQQPADLIVAAGGDGTVRKVATQLAESSASPVPFAIVPLGTANNFARTLQIDDALAKRVKRWRRAKPIRLDLGMVTVRRRSRPFVEGVGGGLLAAAIVHGPEEVEDRSNSARDERRLALELLARLAKENEPERWEIELDGKDLSGDYIAVEALNIGLVGPNVSLAPRADATDGELDLVTIDADSRRALGRQLDARLAGRTPRATDLTCHRFRRARLRPPHGAPFRVDDGSRPWHGTERSVTIDISVRPGAVRMVR
jgi:diacylglycerol kinase family enzyme